MCSLKSCNCVTITRKEAEKIWGKKALKTIWPMLRRNYLEHASGHKQTAAKHAHASEGGKE